MSYNDSITLGGIKNMLTDTGYIRNISQIYGIIKNERYTRKTIRIILNEMNNK